MLNKKRNNIARAIITPLGFFVLSLLIVEGFLTIVLVFSKGEKGDNFNFWGMIIGAFLFTLVVVLVWILIWCRPAHLTLEGKHYFELGKNRIPYAEESRNTTEAVNIKYYLEKIHE